MLFSRYTPAFLKDIYLHLQETAGCTKILVPICKVIILSDSYWLLFCFGLLVIFM